MAWWHVVLILLICIISGCLVGILVSYIISRFIQKRNYKSPSNFMSSFSRKPKVLEDNFFPADTAQDELYQGRVELEITAPQSYAQVLRLQAYITRIPGLRLVSVGESAESNTIIVVESDQPLPLLSILSDIPLTKDVVKTERNIRMALETLQFA